jgi:hypothetical protein
VLVVLVKLLLMAGEQTEQILYSQLSLQQVAVVEAVLQN